MPDYLSELKSLTEGSFLEELDGLNLEVEYRGAVQNSIGYMLLVRCGLDPSEYFEDEDFRDVTDFNTPQTLNALGVAAGDISQMCLSAISRTVLALQRQPKKKIAHLKPSRKSSMLYLKRKPHSRKGVLNMTEITYTRQGDYNLPNLLPPQEGPVPHGKYALLRRQFLKEHRRITYTNLLTSGKLSSHLAEIQQSAQRRMEQIVAQMAKNQGVTEELKASNQMKWVQMMNNIQNAAEETVLAELIYS